MKATKQSSPQKHVLRQMPFRNFTSTKSYKRKSTSDEHEDDFDVDVDDDGDDDHEKGI